MNRNCGQTHHAECWRQHGHSACAEREMARLQERHDLAVKKNGEQFFEIERLEEMRIEYLDAENILFRRIDTLEAEIERQQAMHLNCTKRCHKALMDVERLEGALLVIYEMGAQSDYHLVQEMSKIAKEALSGGG